MLYSAEWWWRFIERGASVRRRLYRKPRQCSDLHCLIMAYVDVNIDRSKLEIVHIIKTRLDSLFNVVVDLITCPSENASDEDGIFGSESHHETVFLLRLSSSNSPENIEKAKIFLKAILEEGPDFNAEPCPLTDEQLEMVRRSSETIERQSLCLLDFVSNPSRLCLKGRAHSIKSARQQVHKVIMGQGDMAVDQDNNQNHSVVTSRTCSGQSRTVHSTHSHGFSVDSSYTDRASDVLPFNKDDILQSPYSAQLQNLQNNFLMEGNCAESMRSYNSLVIDGDYSYTPAFCETDLIPRGAPLKLASLSSFEHLPTNDVLLLDCSRTSVINRGSEVDIGREAKDAGSERNSAASSDEDSGVSIMDKSDARYDSRLEFALKLGYTESDLDRVIGHHGLDCDENKLLQELIVGSSGLADLAIDEGEGSSSPGILTPDITTSEIFQGVMKKVKSEEKTSNLRHIVIDGSNVAMSHGKNVFSCRGIKIAVDWFKQRGHEEITVFVPQWRKETSRTDTPITDQQLLLELEKEGIVVFTPARRIKGRRVVCYDDRFVLKLASETGGIVVSNDNYRDLLNENQEYRRVVDERLLMYTFVNDRFMPPEDPLGRRGPTLDNFLCKEPTLPQTLPPDCPYGRKCTYGNKCKYHHPERGCQPHRTVTEVLKEQATLKMQERATRASEDKAKRSAGNKPKLVRTKSLVPGEGLHAAEDRFPAAQSPLPSSLKESDTDSSSRVKSPTRSSKTSDYLREHRKKLEEHLAIAQSESAKLSSGGIKGLEGPFASRTPEALSPLPVTGSRVSSPSHLNVPPYSATQEGPLVSGHLLLAKKLSDEAAESSFFSNESSSNRASPVPATGVVGCQESLMYGTDKTFDRRPSLQDHGLATRFSQSSSPAREQDKSTLSGRAGAPMRYPSQPASYIHDPAFTNVPQFGEQCQSYPPAEKEMSHGGLRRVTSYTDHHSIFPEPYISEAGAFKDHFAVKPQQSCPPSHLVQSPLPSLGHTFSGKMVRQNSSSDPQLHTAGSSDAFPHPWLFSSQASTTHQPAGLEMQGSPHNLYSPGKFSMANKVQQQQQGLYRSTSVQQQQPFQPLYATHAPSLFERQMSEVVYSPDVQVQSPAFMPHTMPWGAMEMFHAPTSGPSGIPSPTPHHTHHHHHPLHQQQQQLPGLGAMGHQGMAAAWSQQARAGKPPAMAAAASPPPRSYPPNQAISPTDPRYPLYYNLCSIFAEHRVRAVMNKFPDERDPHILTSHIMSM